MFLISAKKSVSLFSVLFFFVFFYLPFTTGGSVQVLLTSDDWSHLLLVHLKHLQLLRLLTSLLVMSSSFTSCFSLKVNL